MKFIYETFSYIVYIRIIIIKKIYIYIYIGILKIDICVLVVFSHNGASCDQLVFYVTKNNTLNEVPREGSHIGL